MRSLTRLLLSLALVGVACGEATPTTSASSPPPSAESDAGQVAGWRLLPPSPLTPRAGALGLWTGSEVLVMGGEPEAWCPPNADCSAPSFVSLSDGAAFSPATGTWRPIADAPLRFARNATAVVVDQAVYVLTYAYSDRRGSKSGFMRYHVVEDRWDELAMPSEAGWHALVATATSVVAYPETDEMGEVPDRVFDPSTGDWNELAADPLPPSYGRTMVSLGDALYLFADEIVPNPGSVEPALAEVVRLDLNTGQWEHRAQANILDTWGPIATGSLIVFPWPGGGDGGEVNNWGRTFPFGGIYDTEADEWSPLPEHPSGDHFETAGLLGPDQATYVSESGSVLELPQASWVEIPSLPDEFGEVFHRTIVAAGRDLFVFGGEVWLDGGGIVIDDVYTWSPPS